MKSSSVAGIVHLLILAVAISVVPGSAYAAKKSEKSLVDSGSFGVFVNGKRVATETFSIHQEGDTSTAVSEFKADDGHTKAQQKAELQLLSNGNLRRYNWRELSPGRAQAVVEPADQFLVEHVTPNPPEKATDQPFLMPVSTMVLDDYFFSHRQILTWRYLAQSCGGSISVSNGCKLVKSQFGVIVPRQRTSSMVSLEYAGREKTRVRDTERELHRFNLSADDEQWTIYVDDQFKIVRIVIAAENTEVLRD
jgi:hypothetical protein